MQKKQTLTFEMTIKDQLFTFTMPLDTTFGAAIDASHEIYRDIIQMAADAAKKEKAQTKEEHAKE